MNVENVNQFKAAISAFLGVLTALWGWTGWLIMAWILAMALDYLSGTARAMKKGEWASEVARSGLWHKAGEVISILVCLLLDVAVNVVLPNVPGLPPNLTWTFLLCPLATLWYLITEAGSIIENVAQMGAPVPKWLRKAIAALGEKLDAEGDTLSGPKSDE